MIDLLGDLLAAVDAVVYGVLVLQLLGWRASELAITPTATEVFALFGAEIRRAVPSIPPGFTWEEAVEEATRLRLDVDWPKVREAVASYEGYRYGGRDEPRGGYDEIRVLVRELRRGR